jgi:hypothetical protein
VLALDPSAFVAMTLVETLSRFCHGGFPVRQSASRQNGGHKYDISPPMNCNLKCRMPEQNKLGENP